jgi:GTP-binding protein YchF
MEIAITGLPQSGKTTLFNALTRGQADTTGAGGAGAQMHVGVAKVTDPRLAVLAEMYHPRKVVYPEIKYWDLPAVDARAKSQGVGGQSQNILQAADAFLLVVRSFIDPAVVHPSGSIDIVRDLESSLGEIALADLLALERISQRMEDGIKKAPTSERPALVRQLDTVLKVKQGIEDGVPLRRQHLIPSEQAVFADYQLLTGKPVIVAINTDESAPDVRLEEGDIPGGLATGLGQVSLCASLESDLAQMTDEEAEEFRQGLGLAESAMDRVIEVSYDTVGLVSFLTVGEDEVRAWSVAKDIPAQEAAGTIHTDFSRGFIRAEVIPYEDLIRCGSIAQGRKEGVLRSEGKTYSVQDGDVINFLIST